MFWEFVQSLFAMFWNHIYYKLRLYCQFPLAIHCYIVTLQQWCNNNLYRFYYLSEPFSKFFPLHLINRRGDTSVVKLYWRFSLSWVIQRFVRGRSLISDSYLKACQEYHTRPAQAPREDPWTSHFPYLWISSWWSNSALQTADSVRHGMSPSWEHIKHHCQTHSPHLQGQW